MTILHRVYRFRMYPKKSQNELLLRQAGGCRWIWNWALDKRKSYYAKHGKGISKYELKKQVPLLKANSETSWLKDIDSQAIQEVLRNLDLAYDAFFRRNSRFPRFKSRKNSRPSFRITQRVKVCNGKVFIPKVGVVKIRQSREIDGATKSATFKQDSCGHWYVTIVVSFAMPDVSIAMPNPDNFVGIDAGLKDYLILSNGEEPIPAPKFFRKSQKKLRRAQRVLSRRKYGSNRRAKAKLRVARIHRDTSNKRNDFLNKESTKLIKRFDGVCIEDLCIKGLVKTKQAKSWHDVSHSTFKRMLIYKAM